jgi:YVTN family beta-propeller protein
LLDARSHTTLAEVRVGDDPRTAAFTPDGSLALVANHGSGTVSIVDVAEGQTIQEIDVGGGPYGVVSGHQFAYVSVSALAEVAVMDVTARAVVDTIAVEPFPTGLALSRDTLYVTHLYSGGITRIDLSSLIPVQVMAADPEANLSQFIALSPDGTRAYLPQTRSHADNVSLTHDTTVSPAVGILDLPSAARLAPLDLARVAGAVNLPFAAAVSPDGRTLYVANAGSDDVSVIDLETGAALGRLAVGGNPRGLALSADGARLFVNNALDGTLAVFDTRTRTHMHTFRLTTLPLSPELLAGKRLFNSALPPMSRGHWLSCATCHFDGGHDARTWLGFPDGPRNTPALFGVGRTLPLHWSGDLDEWQDVELTVRDVQHGAGLIQGEAFPAPGPSNAGRSPELDALAAYLVSLQAPPSPGRAAPETIARGEYAFQRWGCAACHPAPLYTDRRRHDSDSGDPARERNPRGLSMDTPSLLGVWATAPYFHDGSAPTLRDALFARGFHSMGFAMDRQEVEDLVAFMQSLP